MKKVKKQKKGILKDSWSYLKECKRYIIFIICLFFLSAIVTYAIPGNIPYFDDLIKELGSGIEGLGLWELIWFIFKNNFTSAVVSLFSGVLLGIVPVLNALVNGALLGYVYKLASAFAGYGVIWQIIPHGIFELPAIFIALGLGVKLGMFVFFKGSKKKEFKRRLVNSVRVFLSIVLPLLIIAAIIEGLLIFSGR